MSIRIKIVRSEIIYDIDHDTLLIAKVKSGVPHESMTSTLLSTDDGMRYRIDREINYFFGKVKKSLSAYLDKTRASKREDNAVDQWESRDIWLNMPDGWWSEANAEILTASIHSYIVTGVEYKILFNMFGAADSSVMQKLVELEGYMGDIQGNINSRGRVLTMPFHPF